MYIVYKTTCILNGKYYIGVHLERRKSDGYIGCGVCSQGSALALKRKNIKSAFIDCVIKYGYHNFKREVIQTFKKREDAYLLEEKLVTKETIKDKNCLNIKTGGIGGSNKNTSKSIEIFNCEDGTVIKFDSQAECANFLNLKNISGKKRFKSTKYVLNGVQIPVKLKNDKGDFFYFHDIHQACVFTKLKRSRLNDLIKGSRMSANGWTLCS